MKPTPFALLCFLVLPAPTVLKAQSYDGFNYSVNGNVVTITSYTGPGGQVEIPGIIAGRPVTSIGEYAFSSLSSPSAVTVPEGVASIVDNAFFDSDGLTNLTLSGTVTSLDANALSGCDHLMAIDVDPSNPSYSSEDGVLFDKAQAVLLLFPQGRGGSYSIPAGVASIGNSAFNSCLSLSSVTIPTSVTNLGDSAFSGCSMLAGITIPNSVTNIGDSAFNSCSRLTNVAIPSSVTSIGQGPFSECLKLKAITVDASNPSFLSAGGVLFNKAQTLLIQCPGGLAGSYSVPGGVISIGGHAFDWCANLTNITLPDGVISLGDYAFQACTSLKSLALPPSLTSIGSYAFSLSGLTSATLPNSVTSLGDNAFFDCTSLRSIALPAAATNLAAWVFSYCSDLTSVAIPDGVTSVGNFAFQACTSLTNLAIPNSVASIGPYAFTMCTNLRSIALPGRLTSIGISAFAGCSGLTNLSIPNTVTNVGDSAFASCSALTEATLGKSVTEIGSGAFSSCPRLSVLLFEGNAPTAPGMFGDEGAIPTIYYLPGTRGWGSTLSGAPTVLWNVRIQGVAIRGNQFEFEVTGTPNIPVLVEASTNLVAGTWVPLQNSILLNGPLYFVDPTWAASPVRFYRLSVP